MLWGGSFVFRLCLSGLAALADCGVVLLRQIGSYVSINRQVYNWNCLCVVG